MISYIDIILLIIYALAFLYGFKRGLLAFTPFFAAAIISIVIYPFVVRLFNIDRFPYNILVFVAIFIACRIAAEFVKNVAEKILKLIFLNWANRIAGGAFIVIMCIFISWLLFALYMIVCNSMKIARPASVDSKIFSNITLFVYNYFDIYSYI